MQVIGNLQQYKEVLRGMNLEEPYFVYRQGLSEY